MTTSVLSATGRIVTAYLSSAPMGVAPVDLPRLVGSVAATVQGLGRGIGPASPVRGSVRASDLGATVICLECGEPRKVLKMHLRRKHNLTMQEYRAKHALAPNDPLTAPGYSMIRRNIALDTGLGRGNRRQDGHIGVIENRPARVDDGLQRSVALAK